MAERKAKDDVGQAQMQEQADEEAEKGLHGDEVDQTPNEHYTVAGVTGAKQTAKSQAAKPKEA